MSGKSYNPARSRERIDGANTRDSGNTAEDDPFTDGDVTSVLDDAWDELVS